MLQPDNGDNSGYTHKPYEKKVKANKKFTIIDILLSDKYDRE